MRNFIHCLAATGLSIIAQSALSADIAGEWVTIDDKDNSAKSVVEIRVGSDGELTGQINSLLKKESQGMLCKKCPGEFKDKPVVGLNFMWGLNQDSATEWSNGQILDPKSGKVYKAKLSLSEDGNTLEVRGYIGFSIFGRTQVWQRKDTFTEKKP